MELKRVITYGTFDLLHQGHINLLKNAKQLGDYLIVGVTSENYDRYRGKLNVKQSLLERISEIQKTNLADEVIVEEYEGQKIDDIIRLGIDIFAIGSDWLGHFDYLKEFCKVVYLERTKGISSTILRDHDRPFVHFGIVGCGRIANRFVKESKYVSGCMVDGVYGIHPDSVSEFAKRHELSFGTTSYYDFLKKVNAVYIASPHETHFHYAKEALLNGKHVLCEKPMCLSENEVCELYTIAESKHLVLLEALKTSFCPGFQRLVSCAKSGKIGQIKHVDAAFTKLVSANSRELQDNGFGGSVTELASYPLLAIFRILGMDYNDINFVSYQPNDKSVDLFTQINLVYANSMATAKIGLGVKTEGDLRISGTRGYVYVPAPWWKTEYFELRYENSTETEKNFYKYLGDGLRYEIVEFLNLISKEKCGRNRILSQNIAKIIEQYRRSYNKTTIW